jgi:hypothetical protein
MFRTREGTHHCAGCDGLRMPVPIPAPFATIDRRTPASSELLQEWMNDRKALEERETNLARHWNGLPFEPKFFHWCDTLTRASADAGSTWTVSPSGQRTPHWYRLCQVENREGLCLFHSVRAFRPAGRVAEEPQADRAVALDSSRVVVRHTVTFGNSLVLRERIQPASAVSLYELEPEITYRRDAERANPASVTATPLLIDLELQRSSGALQIHDDALVLSYGIFGAPGSGKTHLLLHLLRQIFRYRGTQLHYSAGFSPDDLKYGGLILDPKAALIADVRAAMRNRPQDLIILNGQEIAEGRSAPVNVIDCAMDAFELGRFLVLVARSAGVDASEPYWFNVMGDFLGAAIFLLRTLNTGGKPESITLRLLMDQVLIGPAGTAPIQSLAYFVGRNDAALTALIRSKGANVRDCLNAAARIRRFFQYGKQVQTVGSLLSRAFGAFQLERFSCYSAPARSGRLPLYEQIVEEGKVVLVSVSPTDPDTAKVLCTLVKCLFQHAVLGRSGRAGNRVRPLILACDEYSEIASELPGEPIGDGHFFALARQNGCMGLLATQSVHTLENSSLKEGWRAVFSNFTAKVFMRCADFETAEVASKLAGSSEWQVGSSGLSSQNSSLGSSNNTERRERPHLPTRVLMRLTRGQAAIVGTLDGGITTPGIFFVEVHSSNE